MSAAPPKLPPQSGPNGHITTGHSLLSEAREFERGVTAAVNAAVQPMLSIMSSGCAANSRRSAIAATTWS